MGTQYTAYNQLPQREAAMRVLHNEIPEDHAVVYRDMYDHVRRHYRAHGSDCTIDYVMEDRQQATRPDTDLKAYYSRLGAFNALMDAMAFDIGLNAVEGF